MNSTPLDKNTDKKFQHPRPEQEFSPNFELNSYSCLSDDDEPFAEIPTINIISFQAQTLQPATNPTPSHNDPTPITVTKMSSTDPTGIHEMDPLTIAPPDSYDPFDDAFSAETVATTNSRDNAHVDLHTG